MTREALTFRNATPADASDLAILFDAASRRIVAWAWSAMAAPSQSWFEVGRDRIRNVPESPSHHSRWQVAELDGATIGAFFGFSLPDPYEVLDIAELDPVFLPLVRLEEVAKGSWLLQAVAVFPEWRGQGHGRTLIEGACDAARAAGHARIVLQVESPNTGAICAYHACGFAEWTRLPYVPFPGSDDSGDWVLMVRDL